MKIKFESRFEKDLRKVKDQKVLSELKQIIIQFRSGNYRIGIEMTENTIIFTRFLHRKDIYKFFP